jgi:AraC-like DNA-binding protein
VRPPEPTVLRHRSPALSYDLVLAEPVPRLRGLVRGLQGFEERAAGPVRRRELPSGDGVLILDLGDGWLVEPPGAGPQQAVRHRSFASGLNDVPAFSEHAGRAVCLQVDLTPLGIRALLGVPAGELTGIVVGLEDLLGAEAGPLVEGLHDAHSWSARFALLQHALAARAAEAPVPRPDVMRAWQRLQATGGRLAVEVLARELGCSRRHLARRFAQDVGLPPKAFARVLRFRRAAGLLLDPAGPPLGAVAVECGFSDQAHLTREVRAIAGIPPAALRAGLLPGGAGVDGTATTPPVPSVQDAAAVAA